MESLLQFQENVDLKNYCTYGIGGLARYFIEISSIEEMQGAILHCKKRNIPFMVLGKGSNCLFDDKGYNGVVLLNKIDFLRFGASSDEIASSLYVGAGYSFSLLGMQTAKRGLGGLEFASGIPATVGGAIWMNAGANGNETCNPLDSVDFLDADGILHRLKRIDLPFSYRSSPFQKQKGAIVAATFSLTQKKEARQEQLEIVNKRIKTQPLSEKSAGCVFMNPPQISAGALIDQCGLKGFSIGTAAVSTVHANFLINKKDASATEMRTLINEVKRQVFLRTGIDLKDEIRHIAYSDYNEGV